MQHNEILGFTDQSDDNKAIINSHKQNEERLLRQIENLEGAGTFDGRCLSIARTKFQEAFMWLNRAVFQPQRIELPEDQVNVNPDPGDVQRLPRPSIFVGDVYTTKNEKTGEVEHKDVFGGDLIAVGPHWYVKQQWDAYQAAEELARKDKAPKK